ncbi:MAG: UDP-N-acetylmuramate dehydrogenase [Verrucomicrobia bacterium]|nr:UDP-N-acetylmuramate dehydrogenase [Verrucomicrobiota bacterium]MDE3047302.1 UDP-N-acetylmuramate dehydrogenase [Verrucomicrobiota bacterium]
MQFWMPMQLQKNRRLSEFSTFGIGGPIAYFVEVSSIEDMEKAYLLDLPKMVIGKGSNSLFPDRGFDGLVILNKIDFCHWQGADVQVGSGYSFSLLGVQSARNHFSGLEFASGIPATVGGAVFMNAGANGSETCESLQSVLFFNGKERKQYMRSELEFGYRTSSFQKMDGVILAATFSLKELPFARQKQLEIIDYRMKTQPLKEKSAGCVFRNPPGASAGALIDRCGLKGVRAGGAKVSEIHANFIVNAEKATSEDVKTLIQLVREKVFEQTGILLETEIRIFDER